MPNLNDVALRYSSTPADRGIYLYTETGWVKQTAPTVDMITKAWPDICRATLAEADGGFPGGPYGTVDDYVGSGTNFIRVLFSQFIKILAGGSIRGGDRYNEDGTLADGTKPGFYIAASGACKVAGIEFEGSGGGGVQWGGPTLVGTPLTISAVGNPPALASMNGSDVAFIDNSNNQLRTYRFNGSAWSQVGNSLTIISTELASLAALNNTDVVLCNGSLTNATLQLYRFDGTNWASVGSPFVFGGFAAGGLTALNSTDIAFADGNSDLVRTYRFNGSTWSQVGNSLSITGASNTSITALNATDIAFADRSLATLATYRFDGANWALVGSSLSIPGIGNPGISALNGTDIAFIDATYDQLKVYRFSGSSWSIVGSAGNTGISGALDPAITAFNGTDVAYIDSANDQLRLYRFSFATSIPYARTLTGF